MPKRKEPEALGRHVGGQTAAARGHEVRDLPVRFAVISLGALVGALGLFLLTTSLFQYVYVSQLPCLCPPDGVLSANPASTVPAAVIRRQNPAGEAEQYLAEQHERLDSYGWVNQSTGVVHIPIERAMQLLLERGLPTRPQSESDRFRDKGDTMPSYSSSGRADEPQAR